MARSMVSAEDLGVLHPGGGCAVFVIQTTSCSTFKSQNPGELLLCFDVEFFIELTLSKQFRDGTLQSCIYILEELFIQFLPSWFAVGFQLVRMLSKMVSLWEILCAAGKKAA